LLTKQELENLRSQNATFKKVLHGKKMAIKFLDLWSAHSKSAKTGSKNRPIPEVKLKMHPVPLKKCSQSLESKESPHTLSLYSMNLTFITLIEFGGTFAFAISGIQQAYGKKLDWFGAYVIGLVTAIGGGTIRDLLLDVTPFWMSDGQYFVVTAIALAAAIMWNERLVKWRNALFLFDTIGLGLFTVVGISKSLDAGFPMWVAVAMGAITGCAGGVVRDILLNDVPLLFRRDIYALACVAGGICYFACLHLQLAPGITEAISVSIVILTRLAAITFHIHLPVLQPTEKEEEPSDPPR
jgi:uncharacterized membrane protein YeiH